MKHLLKIGLPAILALAVMSFTIAGNHGAFKGKLKQTADCYKSADFNNSSPCNNGDLPSSGSGAPIVSLCTTNTLPAPDVDHTTCTVSGPVCCFKTGGSSTCDPSCVFFTLVYFNQLP